MAEKVVLVPGIGFGGAEMRLLARRLRHSGYDTTVFPHLPGRCPLAASADKLQRAVASLEADTVHFVGHSLGGLGVLQMFADYPQQRPGRIVTLGSPLLGCLAARRTLALPGGHCLVGPGMSSACDGPFLPLPPGRQVGAIAGRLNILFGFLLAPGRANDTLICVEESRHPEITDHAVLPVSHGSMLLSSSVARYAAHFLRTGAFRAEDQAHAR